VAELRSGFVRRDGGRIKRSAAQGSAINKLKELNLASPGCRRPLMPGAFARLPWETALSSTRSVKRLGFGGWFILLALIVSNNLGDVKHYFSISEYLF